MSTTTTSTPAAAGDERISRDDSLAETAERESNRVLQKLREKTDAVVESFQPRIDAVSSYARNEPTKAILISAASGAALMALVGLLVRASSRPSRSSRRTMAAIRDAALDLADRAHSVASDAISSVHQRASDAQKRVDDVQKRAGEVAGSVADTWQSLRDQAAPVVERFKPQFDAVANYAKEDPTRAALGVVTAGAVLFGLLALIRRSER
ncbi:MAG: hypothetical protein ACXWCU_12405 [Caldimonas sp.]